MQTKTHCTKTETFKSCEKCPARMGDDWTKDCTVRDNGIYACSRGNAEWAGVRRCMWGTITGADTWTGNVTIRDCQKYGSRFVEGNLNFINPFWSGGKYPRSPRWVRSDSGQSSGMSSGTWFYPMYTIGSNTEWPVSCSMCPPGTFGQAPNCTTSTGVYLTYSCLSCIIALPHQLILLCAQWDTTALSVRYVMSDNVHVDYISRSVKLRSFAANRMPNRDV